MKKSLRATSKISVSIYIFNWFNIAKKTHKLKF